MNIDNTTPPNILKLKDHEVLSPFMEYLEPTCVNIKPGESIIVYRTQDRIPVDDYGESPRPRRKFGEEAIKQKLTKEEVDSLSQKKREKIMGDWGLSCNSSEETARRGFLYTYEKLEKKRSFKRRS